MIETLIPKRNCSKKGGRKRIGDGSRFGGISRVVLDRWLMDYNHRRAHGVPNRLTLPAFGARLAESDFHGWPSLAGLWSGFRIRLAGITHVRTSPYYPQSNGKLERWHGTLKNEEFRNKARRDVEEARRVVGNFVTHYNEVRLHSALGYITPHDMLTGRDAEISSPIATQSSRLLARSDWERSHAPPLDRTRRRCSHDLVVCCTVRNDLDGG